MILCDIGVKDVYYIGWLMVILNVVVVFVMLYCGVSFDCVCECCWYIVVLFMVLVVVLVIVVLLLYGMFGMVLLFLLINVGVVVVMLVVWVLLLMFLKGLVVVGGIVFVCLIVNFGGFGSIYFIGWLCDMFYL